MKKRGTADDLLRAWSGIPTALRKALRGLSETDLDRRGGAEGWSIRETVHHLVEANLIASNMIIAALATDGYEFDWTWVWPNKKWMRRVGYDRASVDPALAMMRALIRHITGLLELQPASLHRVVSLNDEPGAERYKKTIRQIIEGEIEHAAEHLEQVRQMRRLFGP